MWRSDHCTAALYLSYGIESYILKAEPKHIHSNLKDDEHKAIKSLGEAQKEGQIVIQRCDKGGATAIMNRDDYVNEIMEQHLQTTVTDQDGDIINVYREVYPLMLHVHHDKLRQVVDNRTNRVDGPRKIFRWTL